MSVSPRPLGLRLGLCVAIAMAVAPWRAGAEDCGDGEGLARVRCLGDSGDPEAIGALLGLSAAFPTLTPRLAARLALDTQPARLVPAVEALEDTPPLFAGGLRALRELAMLDEVHGDREVPVASHAAAAALCGAAVESEHEEVAIQAVRCASRYWEGGGREAVAAGIRPGRAPAVLLVALEQVIDHGEAPSGGLEDRLVALLAETQVRGEWTTDDGMVRRLACLSLARGEGLLGDGVREIVEATVDEWAPRQDQFADGCRLLLALRGSDGYARSGTPPGRADAPPGPRTLPYVVGKGDTLGSINDSLGREPFESGLEIYLAPGNADFRAANPDPDRLQPGTRIAIPDRVDRVGLRVLHEVNSNESRSAGVYLHGIAMDTSLYSDRDGVLTFLMPATIARAQLRFGAGLHRLEFTVAPPHTVLGAQHRLDHLGHAVKPTGVLDRQTRAALHSFQRGAGIEPTGELDDATFQALIDAYGS